MAPGARPRSKPAYPVHFSFFFGVSFLAGLLETRKMADGLPSCSAPAGCPVRCGSRGPVPGQSIKTSTALARQGSTQDCGVLVCRMVSRRHKPRRVLARAGTELPVWRIWFCLLCLCEMISRCGAAVENSLNPFKLVFCSFDLVWF